MEKHCTRDNGSLWLKDRPCKIYVGWWPIFHGPLILPYIIVRHTLYIKKWHRPGVFVSLRALALVYICIRWTDISILYPNRGICILMKYKYCKVKSQTDCQPSVWVNIFLLRATLKSPYNVNLNKYSGLAPLKLLLLRVHPFTSNWQLPYLYQR